MHSVPIQRVVRTPRLVAPVDQVPAARVRQIPPDGQIRAPLGRGVIPPDHRMSLPERSLIGGGGQIEVERFANLAANVVKLLPEYGRLSPIVAQCVLNIISNVLCDERGRLAVPDSNSAAETVVEFARSVGETCIHFFRIFGNEDHSAALEIVSWGVNIYRSTFKRFNNLAHIQKFQNEQLIVAAKEVAFSVAVFFLHAHTLARRGDLSSDSAIGAVIDLAQDAEKVLTSVFDTIYDRSIVHHRAEAALLAASACTSAIARLYVQEGNITTLREQVAESADNSTIMQTIIGAFCEVYEASVPRSGEAHASIIAAEVAVMAGSISTKICLQGLTQVKAAVPTLTAVIADAIAKTYRTCVTSGCSIEDLLGVARFAGVIASKLGSKVLRLILDLYSGVRSPSVAGLTTSDQLSAQSCAESDPGRCAMLNMAINCSLVSIDSAINDAIDRIYNGEIIFMLASVQTEGRATSAKIEASLDIFSEDSVRRFEERGGASARQLRERMSADTELTCRVIENALNAALEGAGASTRPDTQNEVSQAIRNYINNFYATIYSVILEMHGEMAAATAATAALACAKDAALLVANQAAIYNPVERRRLLCNFIAVSMEVYLCAYTQAGRHGAVVAGLLAKAQGEMAAEMLRICYVAVSKLSVPSALVGGLAQYAARLACLSMRRVILDCYSRDASSLVSGATAVTQS